jgi:hypothetical protein
MMILWHVNNMLMHDSNKNLQCNTQNDSLYQQPNNETLV